MLTNTRSVGANFASDMDQTLWTALSHLSGVPPYDLF